MNYTKKAVKDRYENMLWNDKHSFVGELEHPKHGLYYIWHDNGLFGISRDEKKPHCGYASLSELFKVKGL